MKNIYLFLSFLVIPTLFFSISNNLSGIAVKSGVKDNYRNTLVLSQVREIIDNFGWHINARDEFYYNDTVTNSVDSLLTYNWDINSGSWIINSKTVFSYEPTHHYVTNAMVYITPMNPVQRLRVSYDSENRIVALNLANKDIFTGIFNDNLRMGILYNNQDLDTVYTWKPGFQTSIFKKSSFELDNRGRIISELILTSQDSLNWVNYENVTRVYNSNDATTGVSFINLISHLLPITLGKGLEVSVGSINDIIGQTDNPYDWILSNQSFPLIDDLLDQSWYDHDWLMQNQLLFTYENNHLSTITTQTFSDPNWVNYQSKEFAVSQDGNQIVETAYHLNNSVPEYEQRITTTWQPPTLNDDSNIPSVQRMTVTVFPNPFTTDLHLMIKSRSNTSVTLRLYNLKGQLVKSVDAFPNQVLNINEKDLASGIYFLKTIQGEETQVRKIMHLN